MRQRTRVVCTLGRQVAEGTRPQDAPDYIAGLVVAGMDVARLNLSHAGGALDFLEGRVPDYARESASIDAVRRAAASGGGERHVAVLLDLQGIKIRVSLPAAHRDQGLHFEAGAQLRLRLAAVAAADELTCDAAPSVALAVAAAIASDGPVEVAFGDGDPLLSCAAMEDDVAVLHAAGPGVLRHRRGVTFRGVEIPDVPPLPVRDRIDLAAFVLPAIARGDADYVALSFTRSVADVRALRAYCRAAWTWFTKGEAPVDEQDALLFRQLEERVPGLRATYTGKEPRVRVVAKLETRAATQNLDGILAEANAVMVARGDLGLQCRPEDVPWLQKDIVRRARLLGRPAIVATQMLGSMEHSPEPTRAEAADVFNAVLDGADALMLSAETATGDAPHRAVRTLRAIASTAEEWERKRLTGRGFHLNTLRQRIEAQRAAQQRTPGWVDVTDRLTLEAVRIAEGLRLDAIVAATRSGQTARHVARFDPLVPVVAIVPDEHVARRLALSGSVRAIVAPAPTAEEALEQGLLRAVRAGLLEDGARVLVVGAREGDPPGATTVISIRRIRVDPE